MPRKCLPLFLAIFLSGIGVCISKVNAQQSEQPDSFWECQKLTCDWGGLRTSMADQGVTVGSTLTGDVMANIRGGDHQKAVLVENWSVNVMLDMQQLAGWTGTRVRFSAIQNNGGSPSRYIGDVQVASNIEALQTIRMYEAWIEQNIWGNRFSVLAGLYDINFEFDYTRSGALFVNSSQGIGPELASSGRVGAPTFPATALSARIKMMVNSNWYVQAGISDGTPGVEHSDWGFSDRDGIFGIGELGYIKSRSTLNKDTREAFGNRAHISRKKTADYLLKVSLGAWSYDQNYVSSRITGVGSRAGNDKGIYLLADVRSLSWIANQLEPLSWYARIGVADDNRSRFHKYFGTGFTYSGLFADDPDGKLGVSAAAVENSRIYLEQSSLESSAYEVALEGTYKTSVTPWLSVQPDLQYIINPGTDPNAPSAWVLATRISLSL